MEGSVVKNGAHKFVDVDLLYIVVRVLRVYAEERRDRHLPLIAVEERDLTDGLQTARRSNNEMGVESAMRWLGCRHVALALGMLVWPWACWLRRRHAGLAVGMLAWL